LHTIEPPSKTSDGCLYSVRLNVCVIAIEWLDQ
jgi:hypothetical protein